MTPPSNNKLLVLVGPTAVGKTALSLHLAQTFSGEILSADSRLFYRGMDIGTAKPSAAEQAAVHHHFIDICNPDERLTLGEYQEQAYKQINATHGRGNLPMLVGGTGQYITAVVEGWGIPRVPPHPKLRRALEALGQEELARWLRLLDPVKAAELDPRNVRRVIRALEVTLVRGLPISVQQKKDPPTYDILILGLRRERENLYQRIDQRVDQMIEMGLVEEVRKLIEAGYEWHHSAMSGLGYRQLRPYFEGDQTLAEAAERIKFETHRFARQQNTWFRQDDERITWLDAAADTLIAQATEQTAQWLKP